MSEAGRVSEEDKRPMVLGSEYLIQAFFELSTERDHGMQLGPIPMRAIWEYDERYGMGGDTFVDAIFEMDRAYLKEVNANVDGT